MSKCLGHDISVRQHSKSEHWAPCHIQTPSRYDWKIVESDVKPKSNKQTKPNFAYILHLCWPDLRWDSFMSIFENLQHGYCPCLLSEFCFHSISCEQIDGIWTNFAYALTSTRSRLGLLHVNFCKFTTVMTLGYCQKFVSAQYLCEWINGIWSNFAYAFTLTRFKFRCLHVNCHKFSTIGP